MGTNAFVHINVEWLELSIIWFIIAARKGEKKDSSFETDTQAYREAPKEATC